MSRSSTPGGPIAVLDGSAGAAGHSGFRGRAGIASSVNHSPNTVMFASSFNSSTDSFALPEEQAPCSSVAVGDAHHNSHDAERRQRPAALHASSPLEQGTSGASARYPMTAMPPARPRATTTPPPHSLWHRWGDGGGNDGEHHLTGGAILSFIAATSPKREDGNPPTTPPHGVALHHGHQQQHLMSSSLNRSNVATPRSVDRSSGASSGFAEPLQEQMPAMPIMHENGAGGVLSRGGRPPTGDDEAPENGGGGGYRRSANRSSSRRSDSDESGAAAATRRSRTTGEGRSRRRTDAASYATVYRTYIHSLQRQNASQFPGGLANHNAPAAASSSSFEFPQPQ
jgi:hypothetical protein